MAPFFSPRSPSKAFAGLQRGVQPFNAQRLPQFWETDRLDWIEVC